MAKRRKKINVIEEKIAETNIAELIKKAAEGLSYISETDAEILPFTGSKAESVTKEELLKQTRNKSDVPFEERSFDDIFQRLTTISDWFGEEEKRKAEKFAELRDLLSKNLKDLKVFAVGKIQVDIYFVGLDAQENLTGIQTKAIET
jgi:ABC-type Fe3+-hydroxamate transport system substrate-binding protein